MNNVSLSVTKTGNDNNFPVKNVYIEYKRSNIGNEEFKSKTFDFDEKSNEYQINGLVKDTQYIMKCCLENEIGKGFYSDLLVLKTSYVLKFMWVCFVN